MFTDFSGNLLRELVSRNSWEFLWNFTPGNSQEVLLTTSPEIPEKFSGLPHRIFKFRFSPIGVSLFLALLALESLT